MRRDGPLAPAGLEASLYRLYREFFERAERKRRWSLRDDIPWGRCNPALDPAVADIVTWVAPNPGAAPPFPGPVATCKGVPPPALAPAAPNHRPFLPDGGGCGRNGPNGRRGHGGPGTPVARKS
jgi:hypothetical protein